MRWYGYGHHAGLFGFIRLCWFALLALGFLIILFVNPALVVGILFLVGCFILLRGFIRRIL